MPERKSDFPKSSSNVDIGEIVSHFESMSLKERIELMVRAKRITQEAATEAIEKLGGKADRVPKPRTIRKTRSRKAGDRPVARSTEPTPPEDTSQSAA